MALQLTIIKVPPGVNLSEDRKTMGPEGGIIGRGVDNDWVLSDPERFLSSKHCQVLKDGDSYFLVDLSTNGTFVNGSHEPIGRGQRSLLNDGDSFDVGDYRFKVSLIGESSDFPKHPFPDASDENASQSLGDQFVQPAGDPGGDIYLSQQYGGEVDDILPNTMRESDPLLALDKAQGKILPPDHGIENDLYGAGDLGERDVDRDALGAEQAARLGSMEDPSNRLQDSVDWPLSKEEEGLLPEDWDKDLSILQKSPPPKNLTEDASLRKTGRVTQSGLTGGLTKGGGKSPAAQTGGLKRPKPSAKPVREKTAEKKPSGNPVSSLKTPVSGGDSALIESLGLDQEQLSDEQVREISATVGLMMRESLDGLMQILRSRASIKNEFRINITTIQPVENNPIKFSANVDEMLDLMFIRRSKAYKEPLDAVRESFNTIADHQLAVIAGIRSAFRSALGRFDPLILEEEFRQKGKGAGLSGLLKGGMWAAYQEHYQSAINDMERSFQDLFGDEFVQAYEDQLRKLEHARKRDI